MKIIKDFFFFISEFELLMQVHIRNFIPNGHLKKLLVKYIIFFFKKHP